MKRFLYPKLDFGLCDVSFVQYSLVKAFTIVSKLFVILLLANKLKELQGLG